MKKKLNKMNTIEKIQTELREGKLTNNPHACADYRALLSGEYSFYAGQLGEILKIKPSTWNAQRSNFKSDKACDRWYEATEMGVNEVGIELILKRITTLMTGLNSLLKMNENEARNLH